MFCFVFSGICTIFAHNIRNKVLMKSNYAVISFIVLLFVLCSCSSDIESGKQIDFQKMERTKTVPIEKSPDAPSCKIELAIHCAKGNDNRAININNTIEKRLLDMCNLSMEQAADSFINRYCNDYIKALAPLYGNDKNDKSKHSWYEYRYSISTEIMQENDDYTAYIAILDLYEGGAHGIQQTFAMNFDIKTGNLVKLTDIFVQGFERRLNDILFKALERKTETNGILDLQDKGYLCTTDIYPSDNFIMKENSISFIYNVYEIAPYSQGMTELEIPYSDINDLLKKQ